MNTPDNAGPRRTTAYNVQLSISLDGTSIDLKEIINSFTRVQQHAAALLAWELRVVDGPRGSTWAVFDGVVEAEAPGQAAALSEDWMAEVADAIPNQRARSSSFTAQVIA